MPTQTKIPTLDEIRQGVTAYQKKLLDRTWHHLVNNGDWPILRTLYSKDGKSRVQKALIRLGGFVGREEYGPNGWSQYKMSLLGAMLTSQGSSFQTLLERFFQFQRDLFRKFPEKVNVTAAEIKEALELSEDDTVLLAKLLWLGSMGGAQNDPTAKWFAAAMGEAADFPRTGELSKQVSDRVCRFFSPDAPVFQDQQHQALFATAAAISTTETASPLQPHPQEISMSLERLHNRYPDPKKLGFLVMRFAAAKPYERIANVIKATAEKHGLTILRADENDFHADLWGNVRTLLHGCGFGVAVYERIERDEPNANVGLEVGYLMAMNKPVLLLKDKTVPALQSDLAGKLYKLFDPHEPEGSIPDQLTNWLKDNGVIVS